MLCLVLKSTKLSSFKGVHFEVLLKANLGVVFGIHLVGPDFVTTREN